MQWLRKACLTSSVVRNQRFNRSSLNRSRFKYLLSIAVSVTALAVLLFYVRSVLQRQEPVLETFEVDPDQENELGFQMGFGGLQKGDEAIDFAVLDTAGNEVRLSDFAGQPVVLNFWATWCAPCRIEMPLIQAEFEQYEDEGLIVLALSQNEPVEPVIDYFEENGYTFTPVIDEKFEVSQMYGVYRINPSTYFLTRDHTIANVHLGAITEGELAERIEEIMQ